MAAQFRPLRRAARPNNRAMQPELERDDQVVARVVAWHNRHPLATRIRPDQVHSVGVVSLPFAVPGAEVQPPPAPPAEPAPSPDVAVAAPPEPAVEAPAASGDADVELAIETDDPGDPDLADAPTLVEPRPDAQADPAEAGPVPLTDAPAEPPPAQPAAEASTDAPPASDLTADAPQAEASPATIAVLPAYARSWHPLTWWRHWRGDDPRRLPLFTEDFIAPLSPRRVARWAARHGQGTPPLAAGAPRRRVVTDAQRATEGQGAPEVELHVITAAVGVGDQRLRLLLAPGPRGAVLGPRHWSRARLAVAGSLMAAVVLPMAALPWWVARDGTGAVARVAQSASSPAVAASGGLAASAAAAEASAVAAASLAEGEVVLATVSVAPDAVVAAASAVESNPPAPPPVDVAPRRGRIELDPLVARLPDDERQALRRSGRDLRGESTVAASDKAWALVTAPLDQRRAERAAAQLKAVALFQSLPMHVEQMPAGARWRAVFWPFTSAADAEKVRLALADKGLQTEVLEF